MNRRRLVELCDVIVPMRDKPKEFVTEENGIPWCRIEDIEGKFLNGSKSEKYVSKECIDRMNLKVFPVGTVLCAVTGASIGTYAITTRELITNQTFAGLICKENLLYNEFLYYYIKMHTSAFINNSVGCAQAYITRETLENFLVPDLEYDEQVRLVETLKHFDDKIEINNRTNIELETMARTIYDYWFLQFDFPDENGKPYKSSGGKMVWSEELKRDIPEGWKNGNIADLGEIVAGGTPPTTNPEYYSEEGIAWITPNDLSNTNDKYISHGERDISQLGLHNSSAKVMPKGTVLLTSRAPIGYIGIAMNEVCTNQGFKSIVPYDKYGSEFVYYTVLNMVPYIKSLGTGSTFTEVSKEVISKVKIVIPQEEIVENFNNTIITIGEKRAQAEKENKELASLRDFLLPLLMNGQVGFREC